MKSSYLKWVVLALCAASLCLAQSSLPMMKVLDPANGKIGDVITVTGENLDKGSLAKLLITDGKADFPVAIDEQTTTTLKFKIPATVKPGRFSLVSQTRGKEMKEIIQPVRLTVDE
jgi:hypothetical protein